MMTYLHEVVLFLDGVNPDGAEGVLQEPLDLREEVPSNWVGRYFYAPGDAQLPRPDPKAFGLRDFCLDISRLNMAGYQPSRLTLVARGGPGRIGVNVRRGSSGYDGRELARKLRAWGLEGVTHIRVVAWHEGARGDEASGSHLGSFEQDFHLALADERIQGPPVRTEVSTRVVGAMPRSPGLGAHGRLSERGMP
ncbi:hypothetical protein LXT21_39955 [Myxococcus sp. K38C18041901]|uniref:hypothetical protein n=1 Tax=Myxococcus guangdongensis TaxID=2906760 RepID=UPI0020A7EE20|nr:hypothetical protein [Myxococcus guangdongensis]MCP3064966.1 hypothetical protein [Myxococcus guangdongensis]